MLRALKRNATKAKLNPDEFWLNKFRATFATTHLQAGIDLQNSDDLDGADQSGEHHPLSKTGEKQDGYRKGQFEPRRSQPRQAPSCRRGCMRFGSGMTRYQI